MILWIGLTPLVLLLGASLFVELGAIVGIGIVLYFALGCRWYLMEDAGNT